MKTHDVPQKMEGKLPNSYQQKKGLGQNFSQISNKSSKNKQLKSI